MSSSDEETLSERSYRSEPSCKSERSYRSERSGSLSPCPPGDTLPWNLPLHEQKKRKSQDSVLDPAERAVVRVAGSMCPPQTILSLCEKALALLMQTNNAQGGSELLCADVPVTSFLIMGGTPAPISLAWHSLYRGRL
ncbi:hypothetical protein JRQ81_012005 [Phrynocephalus forsythii]|uniref:Microtubule-actin cross-linking factor 1 n=1 Tax=Phrynocephalus forsythii TaxID=171643 RepID=A0A9Q0X770_9SAUR|nr:hypothetical protein JRQ81_012005 [Phrynocephalus forsythii]